MKFDSLWCMQVKPIFSELSQWGLWVWCMQVKPIFSELSHWGVFEIEITVSWNNSVNTHFSRGRGLNYSMCKLFFFPYFFFFFVVVPRWSTFADQQSASHSRSSKKLSVVSSGHSLTQVLSDTCWTWMWGRRDRVGMRTVQLLLWCHPQFNYCSDATHSSVTAQMPPISVILKFFSSSKCVYWWCEDLDKTVK